MSGWFSLAAIEWQYLLGSTPLEITATVCAVWGVFLIARQNIWGWPLGIVWAGISTWLAFTQWQLVSDGILYASYIPIQVYCWAVWARRGGAEAESPFTPTWLPVSRRAALAAAAFFAILLWGVTISELSERVAWIPAPALLWRDSTTTVLNYFAQFLPLPPGDPRRPRARGKPRLSADPLRENPDDRDKLFDLHRREIERLGRRYAVVEGLGEARYANAVAAFQTLETPVP